MLRTGARRSGASRHELDDGQRAVMALMRCLLGISLACLLSGGLGSLTGAPWAGATVSWGITIFVALIAWGAALENSATPRARRRPPWRRGDVDSVHLPRQAVLGADAVDPATQILNLRR